MAVRDLWHKTAPDGTRVQSDRYGRGRRWQVGYRDADGNSRTKRFDRRVDAERFDVEQKAAWTTPLTVPREWV
jgi:hypothetical protein